MTEKIIAHYNGALASHPGTGTPIDAKASADIEFEGILTIGIQG